MDLVIAAVCLLASMLLSGCEVALLSVSRVRVRHAASEGDARARRLLMLLEDRDALLGAVTVANHVSNLGAFCLITLRLVEAFGNAGYAIAFVLGGPVLLVAIEILPKKLFRRYPFRALRFSMPLLRLVGVARFVFRGFFPDVRAESEEAQTETVVRKDLSALSRRLGEQGIMSPSAAEWIRQLLEYRQKSVSDLMVPLRHSVALAPEVPIAMGVELARSHDLEAVPVLGEGGDYVGVFEPALCPRRVPEDRLVRQHMRSLEQTSASESALTVLQRLRKRGRTVALVLNEEGEPVGVIDEDALLDPLLAAWSETEPAIPG